MDIYRENIVDHYKNPRNFGKIENPDIQATYSNDNCGDKITIQAKVNNNKIKKIKFYGEGCAISQASASILTEEFIGKHVNYILKMNYNDVYELIGINLDVLRTKCAMLALETLKIALENDS